MIDRLAQSAHAPASIKLRGTGSSVAGQRHGRWTWWHDFQRPHATGDFINGMAEGLWTFWYASGLHDCEGEYHRGQRQGLWLFGMTVVGSTRWANTSTTLRMVSGHTGIPAANVLPKATIATGSVWEPGDNGTKGKTQPPEQPSRPLLSSHKTWNNDLATRNRLR